MPAADVFAVYCTLIINIVSPFFEVPRGPISAAVILGLQCRTLKTDLPEAQNLLSLLVARISTEKDEN